MNWRPPPMPSAANPPRICRSPLDRSTLIDFMRPYPTATQPQFKLNHKSGGRGTCAAHGEGETPAGGAAPGRTSAQLSATSTPIHPLYNRFPTPHQPFSNRRAEPIIRVPCATQKAFRRRLRPSSQHHAPHPERRRIGSEVVMLPSESCQTSVPFST